MKNIILIILFFIILILGIYYLRYRYVNIEEYPRAWIYYAGDKSQHKQLYQYDLNSSKFNVSVNPDYNQLIPIIIK